MFKLPQYTWDKDRELCKRCKHYQPSIDRPRLYSGALVMRCAANPFKASKGIGTCIDNRTRGPCGKEGRLFVAAGNPVIPESISFGQKVPQG
jgi:hypothetical protein